MRSSTPVVGLVTIGQAPRPDLTGPVRTALADVPVEFVERGVLDGLSAAEVAASFGPSSAAPASSVFLTKLADGTPVRLSESAADAGVQRLVDEMSSDCEVVVVLCTGAFTEVHAEVPLVFPDRVLKDVVGAYGPSGTAGSEVPMHVVAPMIEQLGLLRDKWVDHRGALTFSVASPYETWRPVEIAAEAAAGSPALVVLDCMGYSGEQRDAVASALDGAIPVVAAQQVLAESVLVALR